MNKSSVSAAPETQAPLPRNLNEMSAHVSTVDYLRNASQVRAYYKDDGPLGASATVYIGNSAMSFHPDIWRIIIATVEQVLPVEAVGK